MDRILTVEFGGMNEALYDLFALTGKDEYRDLAHRFDQEAFFAPLASGYWKFYGEPLGAFWCCTGTGVEEFSKLGDSIYFHDDSGIYVNLFAASEVAWPEKGVRLRQETRFPEEGRTTILFENEHPVTTTLRLRIPGWATRGGTVTVTGTAVSAFASPSSYLLKGKPVPAPDIIAEPKESAAGSRWCRGGHSPSGRRLRTESSSWVP